MRKYIHLGFCCLLSSMLIPAYAPTVIRSDAPSMDSALSKDAKASRILASVGRIVEGLVKLVQAIKDPNHKQTALLPVSDMLTGIFDIAANSLPHHELDEQEVQELRELMRDVAGSVEPLLRQYLTENACSMRNYLQAIQLKELDLIIRRSDAHLTTEETVPASDQNEQELHNNVLNALHELVQNLFAIIQHTENHQLVGQSIADMLASIMNVASQTLKYEFLTSRDAEENVALYLESFSTELTKELKHLMLQTALHLRGGKCSCSSKSCCNTCSNNGCGKSCSSKCCSSVCKPCCKPCGTCCRAIKIEDEPCKSPEPPTSAVHKVEKKGPYGQQVYQRSLKKDTRKGCCGCSTCNCSTSGTCGTCCSSCTTTCCKSPATEEQVTRKSCSSCSSCSCKPKCSNNCNTCSQSCCSNRSGPTVCEAETEVTRKSCSSCSSCSCKPKCSSNCNTCSQSCCSNRSPTVCEAETEVTRKSCSSCSSCSCKPKCSSNCNTCSQSCCTNRSSTVCDDEMSPDEMGDRKGSCCSSCGKNSCNGCCHKTEMTDENSSDEMGDRKVSCCSSCGKDKCCCHKTEMTNDEVSPNKEPSRKSCSSCRACKCSVKCTTQCSSCSQSCCRRRRPRRHQAQTPVAEVKTDPTKDCGCTKPKPKDKTTAQLNETKTCCGAPVLTRPPKPHHKQKHDVQYPEQYISRDNAMRIGSDQEKHKRNAQ